ncbi:MAG: amidase family protein, partial [Desulfovibrio sp.]
MTDDLPPRLTTDLFRTASGARLQEIYRTLFHRIAEREDELHVFTDGGFSPRRVLDVLDDLEHHWPDPRVRPPLFGVPVGVKDLYRTAGYAIHAGSLLPASCFRGPEADIVTALKKLGCVVMGITQSSEFAGAAPASTCNPLNPGHTPGGSSSGSAAGVAAGYFPLALGTQTKG